MGTTPTTDNKDADLGVNVVSGALTGIDSAIEVLLIADYPIFFGNPIVKKLLEMGLQFINPYVKKTIGKKVVEWILDVQTKGEASGVIKATNNIITIIESKGDQNVLNQASKDFDIAATNLVHFDGVTQL